MNVLAFIAFLVILGYLAFRAMLFFFNHIIATLIILLVMIVSLFVMADEDLLPKTPPQTTISQQ